MLHPSYTDLIEAVNSGVEPGEQPVVQSRYSIVIATAKRARQLALGARPMVKCDSENHLDVALLEIGQGLIGYEFGNPEAQAEVAAAEEAPAAEGETAEADA